MRYSCAASGISDLDEFERLVKAASEHGLWKETRDCCHLSSEFSSFLGRTGILLGGGHSKWIAFTGLDFITGQDRAFLPPS